MNSERNILKRLLEGNIQAEEGQDLDEKTYTVGNTQYWKRSGKCYSWTQEGGRKECSEDEYLKAISGGKGDSPKPTEPEKDIAKAPSNTSQKKQFRLGDEVDWHGDKFIVIQDEEEDDDYIILRPTSHFQGDEDFEGEGDSSEDVYLTKDMLRRYHQKSEPEKSEYSPIEQRRNAFYDDSESDHVTYQDVKDFDHTSWDVDGYETTITRHPSGRGYYLQNEDYDMEFDTKGDLVRYLRNNDAEFAGYDSENDY